MGAIRLSVGQFDLAPTMATGRRFVKSATPLGVIGLPLYEGKKKVQRTDWPLCLIPYGDGLAGLVWLSFG